ncbi:hypothetical protein Patl1_30053 [Pistacia atlantica]|uniref:Uncharacterized protein n=1 Tax=Pistacia atlantica TaxID=434234 RepID=A0ACC1ABQ1_9ROSI|nr:hypothetical protein Patl1_30053 [Pistacia atlantica]
MISSLLQIPYRRRDSNRLESDLEELNCSFGFSCITVGSGEGYRGFTC